MTGPRPQKVSVCIPVYNGSKYIAESIESVLGQTYEDFHLVVCDNCSTDNTEEIVRSFRDPRLKYMRNAKNLGLVGNANRCLELADGEYICIWHHDDVMLPENLERKVDLLDKHPDVGFVHSNLILIDQKGEIVAPEIWSEDSRRDYIEDGLTVFRRFLFHLSGGSSIFIGAVLFRRKCYEKVGGFNPELPHCNDSEMWMRIMLFFRVACIGTPLVRYRVHPTSTSNDFGDYSSLPYFKEHYLAVKIIFEKYDAHIPKLIELKSQTKQTFSSKALKLAARNIGSNDFYTGKAFLKEAILLNPGVLITTNFLKSLVKILIGLKGIEIFRNVRTLLFRS
jgi:glycosyltransferase involved in cell wall biosynthesis